MLYYSAVFISRSRSVVRAVLSSGSQNSHSVSFNCCACDHGTVSHVLQYKCCFKSYLLCVALRLYVCLSVCLSATSRLI